MGHLSKLEIWKTYKRKLLNRRDSISVWYKLVYQHLARIVRMCFVNNSDD